MSGLRVHRREEGRALRSRRCAACSASAARAFTPGRAARRRRARVEDARLTERIREIHAGNRECLWLAADPRRAAARRRRAGRAQARRAADAPGRPRRAWSPRKRGRTTIRVPGVRVCEDLVDRAFLAAAPEPAVGRRHHLPATWEGWLYLVAVQDSLSRRIVGWAMADHMRTELVTDALQMALAHRRPAPGLIWHSDQGSQFVSPGVRPAGPRRRASPSRWAAGATASTTPSPRASSRRSRRS